MGEIPAEHNEIETLSQAWTMTARARIGGPLTLTAALPWVDRTHRHEHEHHPGTWVVQSWTYQGAGDLAVLGTYAPGGEGPGHGTSLAVLLGFKAPTGRTEVDPDEYGDQPEPGVRPGTGSWDGFGGLEVRRWIGTRMLDGTVAPMPFAIGLLGRANGVGTDDYRMGNELRLNLSGGWAMTPRVSLLAQINSRFQVEDGGSHAGGTDPNSGGTSVLASPGVHAAFGRAAVFGYLQFRLYERVNGIQITSPFHVMIGTTWGFEGPATLPAN